MISELLLASRNDALGYANQSLRNIFPKLEANTVDTVKLASLALILDGKELCYDDALAFEERFEEIANQGEDGPWLYECPSEFRASLAVLNPDRMLKVAEAWVATEEAQLDRWTVADTAKFLEALSHFCAEPATADKVLFLFVSL